MWEQDARRLVKRRLIELGFSPERRITAIRQCARWLALMADAQYDARIIQADEANRRAEALLLDTLPPEEVHRYRSEKRIRVTGPASCELPYPNKLLAHQPVVYEINCNALVVNITQLTHLGVAHSVTWCLAVNEYEMDEFPPCDLFLTQYLWIRYNHDDFRRKAVRRQA